MKNISYKLLSLIFIAFILPQEGISQDNSDFELSYEVNRVYPYISISKEQLKDAKTLIDLHSRYEASWVRKYISVETFTSHEGKIKKTLSKDDTISQAQKEMMNTADAGTDISVKVLYLPENTLTHNDVKEISFTFEVNPEKEASYSGGEQQLQEYLKKNAMDKISDSVFKRYQLTAVKFTVTENGQIIDAHVAHTSNDEATDKVLLETICNMPNWQPAEYTDGTKVKQDFVLMVGDKESCVINLLSVKQY